MIQRLFGRASDLDDDEARQPLSAAMTECLNWWRGLLPHYRPTRGALEVGHQLSRVKLTYENQPAVIFKINK